MKWSFAQDWEAPVQGFVFEGKYGEVDKPKRLVQVLGDGRVMTTVFDDVGGKTKVTLTVEMAESEERERAGWGQILDNLGKHGKHVATLSGKK